MTFVSLSSDDAFGMSTSVGKNSTLLLNQSPLVVGM